MTIIENIIGGTGSCFQLFIQSDNNRGIYADAAARDVYFGANPSELARLDANEFLLIKLFDDGNLPVNSAYQQRASSAWVDVTSLVQGDTGPAGATGNSYFFASIVERDLFFDTPPNKGLLVFDLPIVVNIGNDTSSLFLWKGISDPISYDPLLWFVSALNASSGTLYLGEDGTSISSSIRGINSTDAYGNKSRIITSGYDDSGGLPLTYPVPQGEIPFTVTDVFDAVLPDPQSMILESTADSLIQSFKVRPASAGELRLRAWAGPLETDGSVLDMIVTVAPGDIGNEKDYPLPNDLQGAFEDTTLLKFTGVSLYGGVQTIAPFIGQTTPYLKGDIQLLVDTGIAVIDESGSVESSKSVLTDTMTIGEEVPKGTLMALSDWNPATQEPIVVAADSNDPDRRPARGVTMANVDAGDTGVRLLHIGVIEGLDTSGAANNRAPVYLGSAGGRSFTDNTNFSQEVGAIREIDAVTGSIRFDVSSKSIMSTNDSTSNIGDRNLVVGIKGIDIGGVVCEQSGGVSTYQSNSVTGVLSSAVRHDIEKARPQGLLRNITGSQVDVPIFTTDANILVDPTFLFSSMGDVTLTSINLKSGAEQTNVEFCIRDTTTGLVLWKALVANTPANNVIFPINFKDYLIGNNVADLLDGEEVSLEFKSKDGPVLLRGNSATSEAWLEVSYTPWILRDVAFLSDITGSDGIYHVDINAFIPLADQDGSLFKEYSTFTYAFSQIGGGVPGNQHTVRGNAGSYAEVVTMPLFTHLTSNGRDSQSVNIQEVKKNSIGDQSSISNVRANILRYDTSNDSPNFPTILDIDNVGTNSGMFITGHGAGGDTVTAKNMDNMGGVTIENADVTIRETYPSSIGGQVVINANVDGVNTKNGYVTRVTLRDVDLSGFTDIIITPIDDTPIQLILINAIVPPIVTNATGTSFIQIAHDSISEPASVTDLANVTTYNLLSKGDATFFNNTGSPLVSEDTDSAILEVLNLIDSPVVTGTWTSPGDANITPKSILEVTNVNGNARFNYGVIALEPQKYQTVTVTGFSVNTAYNVTAVVSAAGAEYFELTGVAFGSDELGGTFSAISTTVIEVDTVLSNGDTIALKTNGSEEYDGIYTVYGVAVNSWRFDHQFGTNKQGTWSSTPSGKQAPLNAHTNGALDTNPTLLSIDTTTTFSTTSGDFAYKGDIIFGNAELKTYAGQTGISASSHLGVQRNIYVFINLITMTLVLSFDTPDAQPEHYSYIGNFDCGGIGFADLVGVTRVIHTAYSSIITASRLITTKGNYRLSGLIFNGGLVADTEFGITAGQAIREGANTENDPQNPDIPDANTENNISVLNRQYINTLGETVTLLEVGKQLTCTHYAPGGVLTPLSPVSRFQVIYMHIYPGSWAARAQLGDKQYATQLDAEHDIDNHPIGQSPQTHEAVMTTAVIVAGDTTSFLDPASIKFIKL